MRTLPLVDLLEPLVIKRLENITDSAKIGVTGLACHSALVQPGNLFISLAGRRAAGWLYAREAVGKGAPAVVVEEETPVNGLPLIRVPDVRLALALMADRFYGHPSRQFRLVGVTGTNGKTTTAHLIDALFSGRGEVTGLLGTVGYRIGGEQLPAVATTPEAPDLQALMLKLVQAGAWHVTMEVSSHALSQKRVVGCDFDIAVFTNITGEHLDFHGTFAEYLEAKSRLFSGMGWHAGGAPRAVILNADDPFSSRLAACSHVQVISYGIDNNSATVRAKKVSCRPEGIVFEVDCFAGRQEFSLPLRGRFNVYNALAAVCVGLVEGFSLAESGDILNSFAGVPGRFEAVEAGQDFAVLVDYAHTPDALENILQEARALARNRLIVVFGCGGERDRSKRPEMGAAAARYGDLIVITNDNPRREDPEHIVEEIIPGLTPYRKPYRIILDRRAAIRYALQQAGCNDMVVIAGKGHEDYQVLGDRVIPFCDRTVARELIAEMKDWRKMPLCQSQGLRSSN